MPPEGPKAEPKKGGGGVNGGGGIRESYPTPEPNWVNGHLDTNNAPKVLIFTSGLFGM